MPVWLTSKETAGPWGGPSKPGLLLPGLGTPLTSPLCCHSLPTPPCSQVLPPHGCGHRAEFKTLSMGKGLGKGPIEPPHTKTPAHCVDVKWHPQALQSLEG